MSFVFVLDPQKHPLDPVHPGGARRLLTQGKAAVFKYYPFTIILTTAGDQPAVHPFRIKIDPGSKHTGLALVNDATGQMVFAAELTHREHSIKKALDQRCAVRRSRRQRTTRYRKPRGQNRRRRERWLPPSLESRIANILTWVQRLRRLAPLVAVSQEVVRFDLHQMENPEISGVEYQQGELAGYEVREYLLEKWQRRCAYCGRHDGPLQIDHIQARASGGTNRISNLCLACEPCNRATGTQDVEIFLATKPDVLQRIRSQATAPLNDATAVNATRWSLFRRLQALGLPVEVGSGGLTKFNRTVRAFPKAHAVCVGKSTPEVLQARCVTPLLITATGHGTRQKCRVNGIGFPCSQPKGAKKVQGFQTGDLVRATVPTGKNQGASVGRVLVRASGSFDLQTTQGRVQGISHRFCTLLHRCDGYTYTRGARHADSPAPSA